MLVLSRKPGQRIQIGDHVSVVVVGVQGVTVRLGFEAPNDVRIMRDELLPVAEAACDVAPEPQEPQHGQYDGGGQYADGPTCRRCILEFDRNALFEDDLIGSFDTIDSALFSTEPTRTIYRVLPFPEQGPCGSCLPVP